MGILCLCVCVFLAGVTHGAVSSPKVDAPAGTFEGFIESSPSGQEYAAFTGIPYAQPPVGDLRFAKPQPLPKLDSVFKATSPSTMCPHPDLYLVRLGSPPQGKEDCLTLNIYTPDVTPTKPLKVMVFIHGGGYVVGSSSVFKAGTLIKDHDIILVAINYRLGILGFLSTGDASLPGNAGLWDMALALQWVKDNIEAFGGDPDDIAISGESAGASAVGYLSISPHTKGLFTKAWPMSGTPTSLFGKALTPLKDTLDLASNLKCFDGDSSQIVSSDVSKKVIECLRQLPLSNFTSFSAFHPYNAMFVPTVDKDFVPDLPSVLLKDEAYLNEVGFYDRSYLVGVDNNEAAIMKQHFQTIASVIRQREDMTTEEKEAYIDKMVASGYSLSIANRFDQQVSEGTIKNIVNWYSSRFPKDVLGEIAGDFNFLLPTFDFIDALARKNHEKTWFFHFNHYPSYMKGRERGIIHGLDLVYWVDGSLEHLNDILQAGIDLDMGLTGSDDQLLGRLMRHMVADFTKTGGVTEVAKALGVDEWPAYNLRQMNYLDFKPRSQIKQNLHSERRHLWLVESLWENKAAMGNQHQEL